MKIRKTANHRVVLVTAPNVETARHLAGAILDARVAACATLVPQVESHYWWKGKKETGTEVLLVIKTTARCVAALARVVRQHHPYDTPEFVSLALESGSQSYLTWLTETATSTPVARPVRRAKGRAKD